MTVGAFCKFFIKCAVVMLLFAMSLIVSDLNIDKLKSLLASNFSFTSLFLVTGLFILNFYIVAARLYVCYKQFNLNVTYAAAKNALLAGQIGGIIPVFGSVLGQSIHLKNSSSISSTTSTFVYFYERIMMAASGAVISLVVAYFTIENKFFFTSDDESAGLVEYLAILILTLFAVWCKGLSDTDKANLKTYLSVRNVLYASASTCLSICSWLLSALCFLICVYFSLKNHPEQPIPYANIFFLSIIVSFLSSLPLSVNGWGIREFSAITVFGLLAIPKEISLFSSLSVGVFSLLALLCLGTVYYFRNNLSYSVDNSCKNKPNKALTAVKSGVNTLIDTRVVYWMGYLCAFFIFFQAHFGYGKANVNINLADIFAICGFVVAVLNGSKFNNSAFRMPHVKTFFLWAIAVFSISFLWGLYQFGFTGFSFFSKFIGFFILIGYFSVGFLFIGQVGTEKGFETLLNLMTTVLACIILFQLVRQVFEVSGFVKYNHYHTSLLGYAGNRNAFAIQVLSVIAMQLSVLSLSENSCTNKNYWFLSILFSGVFFTYSRSAVITAIILLVVSRGLGLLNTKQVFGILIRISSIIAGILLLESFLCFVSAQAVTFMNSTADIPISSATAVTKLIQSINPSMPNANSVFMIQQYSPDNSNSLRLYSIVEGLRLWIKNPFFGIGLGGFVHHEMIKNGLPLVIHNTFVWILSEFGIVGSLILFYGGFFILKHIYYLILTLKAPVWCRQDKLLLNIVIIFLLMGSVHEIFYQRILWFMLGLIMVSNCGYRDPNYSKKLGCV